MYDATTSLRKTFEEIGVSKWWEDIGEARGEARGIAVGEARGLEKGGADKAAEIARKMLASGFPAEQVAQLSGVSLEQIKTLAADVGANPAN